MARTRPFVYLSEALVAHNDPIALIERAFRHVSPDAQISPSYLQTIWTESALSVKAQAALFRSNTSQFKPQRYQSWIRGVVDHVSLSLPLAGKSQDAFRQQLCSELLKIQNYKVPVETEEFIDRLVFHSINWGVIANESYLYPSILAYLRLHPFATIMGQESYFKPLSKTVAKAIEKIPRDSRHAVWFIGSSDHPCDNLVSDDIRSVLVGGISDLPAKAQARHFRVKSLRELEPLIMPLFVMPDMPELSEEDRAEDDDDVVLRETNVPRNPLLPLGKKESSIAKS